MEEHDMNDTSHPFFVRGGFPFVFLPSTLANGFGFANHHAHVPSAADQSATAEKAENAENNDDADEERTETLDDDEGDRRDASDEGADEKSNLRISQPKYSQLLKELDFSHARMVDVTDLLPNELDQQETQSINDDDNQRRTTDDEKYQSLSSARSSISEDEPSNAPTVDNNSHDNETEQNKTRDDERLFEAAKEVRSDLTNLATIINEAAARQNSGEASVNDELDNESQKKPPADEEDDTSKQATQDYELHENDPENVGFSSKSSRIRRIVNQESYDLPSDGRSALSQLVPDVDTEVTPQTAPTKDDERTPPELASEHRPLADIDWHRLLGGDEARAQSPDDHTPSEPMIESHSTPKKALHPQSVDSSDEKSKPRTSSFTKQKLPSRSRPVVPSSSSSSDTDSIVERGLHRSKEKPPSAFHIKPPKAPLIAPQPLRQDSQATLIDDNLDELSSQLRQVLEHERQPSNGSVRAHDVPTGTGAFQALPKDAISSALDDEALNRRNDELLRQIVNQRTGSHQQRHRHASNAPERSGSHRKKREHHQHHHRHERFTSREPDRAEENDGRNTDDDWLTMLDRLEQEHQARIEQQRRQYEDYMHTLEDRMTRRFDDHGARATGSQGSRSDDYDNTAHLHRAQTSLPRDFSTRRYNSHGYNQTYRPSVADLVSHYYPADSTLNVLSAEKKRSTAADHLPSAQPRDEVFNGQPESSARHENQVDDAKLRYENEINDLRTQLNRPRFGDYSSSSVRQSMGTIERLNSDNIRLRDEISGIRHSMKVSDDENVTLKRQLDELREQINHKDLDLKNYHRTITNLERQVNEAESGKERHNEKLRHAERQTLLYRDENEKLKVDLNRTRERLLRLEERSREQENENETLRRQLFLLESDNNRIKNRMTDDHKLSASMSLNASSPRDYSHFASAPTTKHSSSTISTPRDGIIDSGRYQSNDIASLYPSSHSPRPLARSTDYFPEKPFSSLLHVSPSRHVYSPKKSSPTRRRTESMPRKDSFERLPRQTEQLEQKFDQLLKKKRDLETRLNRIPVRGLTNIDHQLYDALQREIERVDHQIVGVKLDLRKSHTVRAY